MDKQTVLITGGSRGVGRSIVLGAVKRGHKVLFTYNSGATQAEETVALARAERADAVVHAYQLDVKDADAVDALIERLIEEHDQIHALINNAAIVRDGAAALMTNEQWREVLDTNLSGPFYLARALLMHFLPNHFGRIVNMISLAAYGSSGQANYSASKSGLIGLTLALAREYGARNITTNAIVVGMVETDMVRESISKGLKDIWQQYSPIRRIHTGDEMANATLFLISDQASAINGEIMKVTGGLNYAP